MGNTSDKGKESLRKREIILRKRGEGRGSRGFGRRSDQKTGEKKENPLNHDSRKRKLVGMKLS